MDYQTLYVILFASLLIQMAALLLSWRQNPHELGLRDWGLSAALMCAGSLLVLSGLFFTTPPTDSTLSNLASLLKDTGSGVVNAGWLLAWIGIRHFYRIPSLGYGLVATYGAALTLILVPGSTYPGWRVLITGLSIGIIALLIIRELYRDKNELSLITHIAGIAMGLVAITWLSRGLLSLADLNQASGSRLIDRLCLFSSIILSMVFTFSLILLTNQRVHQRLLTQASIDHLTGSLNRRAFFEACHPLLAGLQRNSASLAVCVLDLDNFKKVNDAYGHAVGDEVLITFSRLARASLRDGDLFARYGGEEFVILLQQSDAEQAIDTIERLRSACAKQGFTTGDKAFSVTFSAGICHATGPTSLSLETLLKAADDALYRAKAAGRNCTMVC